MRFSVPEKLILQAQEILVRLELRIVLRDHEQAAQCAFQLVIRRDPSRRSLRAHHCRARVGHRIGYGQLLLGETLHRLHQIRDQIRRRCKTTSTCCHCAL